MENRVGEDDIKELEDEIDSAVDRLFVDKKSALTDKLSTGPLPHESPIDKKGTLTEMLSTEPLPHESPVDKKSTLTEMLSTEPLPHESPVDKKSTLTEMLSTEPLPHESTIDKESATADALSIESLVFETPSEPVKPSDREGSFRPSPKTPPYLKLFEKMETQLLSLEWEITRDNLQKTKDEVLALRDVFSERPDINSVLNLMEKVLVHMIKNGEHIQPPQIKFLLDSKEAIKLLMKKETSSEINTYKQLIFGGIGARFLCLEGLKETRGKPSFSAANEERAVNEIPRAWEERADEILEKMALFSKKLDEILKRFEYDLSRFGEMSRRVPEKVFERKLLPLEITIFKIDDKLFGIESQKVFKLFKLPSAYRNKIFGQQRIRLKEFEIQMVDLKKVFSTQSKARKRLPTGRPGEIQLLTVREDGEYKGLVVDQLLKKLSAEADMNKDYGEYFLGIVHWTYQEKAVKIPILNLKRI